MRGRWVNQNGSTLIVKEMDGAGFRGTFSSRKGRSARDKQYAVHGVVNGELVTFVVSFDDGVHNLHSITNFTGRLVRGPDGSERLHTLWVLARQFEDEARTKPTQVWNSFLLNTDVFERVSEN